MPEELDLARLLNPVEPGAFFRDFWEKQPLAVARDAPTYYGRLFGLGDVDRILAFTRPRFPNPGDFAPGAARAASFVQGMLPDDEALPAPYHPDVTDVQQAFAHGKTLIVSAVQHRWPSVAALCRNLEALFGCPVHANLYLTPPNAQGFAVHFDTHEVFVLQIEGAKHWRFYGPARELPLAHEKFSVSPDELGPVTQEALVRPGDLLYMPRGHAHEAFTSERTSLHLTVGVKVYRWADLLRRALDDLAAEDVRFRASLPPGWQENGPLPPTLPARFRELLGALAETARAGEALDGLASSFVSGLASLPGGAFSALAAAEQVGPDTMLEKAPGVICRVTTGPGGASLVYPGNRLEGPPKIASALRFVARATRFAARDLPDDLTAEGKLLLVRRLVRERFLVVAAAGGRARESR